MSVSALPKVRRKTRPVKVGPFVIGGGNPIRVQSMTATDTADVESTCSQIQALAKAGCEIVRLTVDTPKAAHALTEIRRRCAGVVLVADIHFNHRLALEAAPLCRQNPHQPG